MIDFLKIDNENYPKLVREDQERYALVTDDDILIGASVIDTSVTSNRIVLNINEDYRSEGHAKKLFMMTLEEYKSLFNDTELSFEIDNTNHMNAILSQNGAIHIGTAEGISSYILPLK